MVVTVGDTVMVLDVAPGPVLQSKVHISVPVTEAVRVVLSPGLMIVLPVMLTCIELHSVRKDF